MITETDASVIERSLQQPECFELVFDRHFARVLSYLRRRIGGQLAEELAAETFERAFTARGRFVPADGSALPWLYGIAANLLRMHHRAEQRRLRAYARAAALAERDGVGAPTEPAGLTSVVAEALAALSPALREVLLLHCWGELGHDEISAALRLSPQAVRTRLHRARDQVARRLSAAGELVAVGEERVL